LIKSMSYWVYILYSESTGSYYKGQTQDIEERIIRHNNGYEKSTKKGIPWKLIWKTEKADRSSAMRLEKKLKNMTRSKLIDFINKYNERGVGPDVP
jgi:putative endonuclease